MLAHVGLLGFMAWATTHRRKAVAETPAPVLVHLAQPRARAAIKPAPAPAPRPRPRPQALVQPPTLVEPPPPTVEAPPEIEEPIEESDETGDAEQVPGSAAGPAVGSVGGTGNEALELREVAKRPAVLQQVTPEYPADARWRRLEGVVVVRVILDTSGAVEAASIKVMKSVPGLDPAAIAAIKRWRFSPAIGHSGQPVRVIIEVPFDFSLH